MRLALTPALIAAAIGSTTPAAALDGDLADLPALFPPGLVRQLTPGADHPAGGWIFETFRAPELSGTADNAMLSMFYNGIDDETWPYPRILQVLLADLCGKIADGTAAALVEAAYAEPSAIPPEDAGGNGGETMQMALVEQVGHCQVQVHIGGARWHTIATVITR